MSPWKIATALLSAVVLIETALLFRVGFNCGLGDTPKSAPETEDGFEAFESIAFAKEFSERFQSFDSETFRNSQMAVAFLMSDEPRAQRISEIERLQEKIEKAVIKQSARLMTLTKLPGSAERFRAKLQVDLSEGSGARAVKSRFFSELEFSVERTARSSQNTWGFLAKELSQRVLPADSDRSMEPVQNPVLRLRPKIASLVRFPCPIENVELPKGTKVRVKLTTLDISELQMRTETSFEGDQPIRAICRDRAFTMKLESPLIAVEEPLVVFRTLTMENSAPLAAKKRPGKKLGIEKSVEEQLGFIVEE